MKTTIKQLSTERASILNKLEVFKTNKVMACNTQWMQDGNTFCEIYSKSTKKRTKINTNRLFLKELFINDMDKYILNSDWFKSVL